MACYLASPFEKTIISLKTLNQFLNSRVFRQAHRNNLLHPRTFSAPELRLSSNFFLSCSNLFPIGTLSLSPPFSLLFPTYHTHPSAQTRFPAALKSEINFWVFFSKLFSCNIHQKHYKVSSTTLLSIFLFWRKKIFPQLVGRFSGNTQ